jgi:non-ribosomal peptide synthetase component E (peptide arylation enzyme)
MKIKACGQHDTVDLLTFAFGGSTSYDPTQPLYIDAEDPSCCLNADEFKSLVRSLIAGLKAAGTQPGDCVLLHLPNSVSFEQRCQKPHLESFFSFQLANYFE